MRTSVARLARLGLRLSRSSAAGAALASARAASTAAPKLAASFHGSWVSTGAAMFAASLALGASTAYAADSSPKEEKSFIMVKPDGVHRGLVSEVMARFERKGYKLVGVKVLVPSKELAGKHYAEHEGKPFYPKLVDFLSSGPVVAMVWEGKDVIKYGRTMIGATNPIASAPGTIRGDYGIDVGRNIIHGSDGIESAQREIALWFSAGELASYTPVASPWVYE